MQEGLTKEQMQVHNRLQTDLPFFCAKALKIKDKDGELSPFVLNQAQLYIHKKLEEQKAKTGKVRAIILKGRQMGASTLIGARFFHNATRNKGKNVFILTHETGSTIKLFDMVKRFHDYMPDVLKPRLKNLNSRGLVFQDLDSQYFVGSAGNEAVGRGGTLQMLHGCIAEDSLVELSDGSFKPMGDMQAGDLVITSSGKIAPVKTVIKTGRKQLYKIEVEYSKGFIEVSADHKILTRAGYKRAEDLTENDYIKQTYVKKSLKDESFFFSMHHLRNSTKGLKCQMDGKIEFNLYSAVFCAAFILFGRPTKQNHVSAFGNTRYGSVYITINDLTAHDRRILRDFASSFGFKCIFRKKLRKIYYVINSTFLAEFCNQEFIDEDGNKIIPNWLLSANNRFKCNVIQKLQRYGNKETTKYLRKNYKKVRSVTKTDIKPTLDLEVDHHTHNFNTPIGVVSNSEVAFWPNTSSIRSGLMQSVPKKPGTEIILESTANGLGNMFHQMSTEALKGDSEYQVIFTPWYWMDDYQLEIPKGFKRTDEEQEIVDGYLKPYKKKDQDEKLAWRRVVYAELGSLNKFRQEYPNSFVEAFQSTGESLINPADIIRARQCETTDPHAPVIIGVDPARDGDRSCVVVRQGRHIVKYFVYQNMDSMSLSGIVANLIDKYNPVMTNVDIGVGYGVIDRLLERGFRNINAIHFSSKASEPEIYRNIRAEMYVRLAEWFKGENINIPDDDEMHADLAAMPQYKPTSDGTIRLAPKSDIIKAYGKSIDIADATALTHALNFYGKNKKTVFKIINDTNSKWD